MVAFKRLRLTRPHLKRDPQEVFQPLEPLCHWRKRNAQPAMLLFVPARADAKIGPSAGEDIERRRRLDQDARIAIRNASDHRAQADALGFARGKRQRAPPLQHLLLFRANPANLEEMIHHPQAIESGVFCAPCDVAEGAPQLLGAAGPGKSWNLQTYAHVASTVGNYSLNAVLEKRSQYYRKYSASWQATH